jgi:hypothetical protein
MLQWMRKKATRNKFVCCRQRDNFVCWRGQDKVKMSNNEDFSQQLYSIQNGLRNLLVYYWYCCSVHIYK